MTDITKCKDSDCPLKKTCYRYTAKVEFMQSYFLASPYDIKKNVCEMYCSEETENIYRQFQNLLK